jgi:hypothetical protein
MSFTDAGLVSSRFTGDSKPDDRAFERALLRIELSRSLIEAFPGKYLKGASAPDLDLTVQIDKK